MRSCVHVLWYTSLVRGSPLYFFAFGAVWLREYGVYWLHGSIHVFDPYLLLHDVCLDFLTNHFGHQGSRYAYPGLRQIVYEPLVFRYTIYFHYHRIWLVHSFCHHADFGYEWFLNEDDRSDFHWVILGYFPSNCHPRLPSGAESALAFCLSLVHAHSLGHVAGVWG